jgi:hypothetical protein
MMEAGKNLSFPMVTLVITMASLLVLCSCDGRGHTNPFDSANPDTGGNPGGLFATSGCSQVTLTWTDFEMQDLLGVNVYRTEDDQEQLNRLTESLLPSETVTWTDTTAINNTRYNYTLELVFDSGDAVQLTAASAEPGTALPWVADPCGSGISLLASDCRRPREQVLFGHSILDIEIDPTGHRIFVPIIDSDRIEIRHSVSGRFMSEFSAPGASCLSWQPGLSLLSVGAFYEERIFWFSDSGEEVATLAVTGNPEDVALRDSTTTWLVLREGGVRRIAFASGVIDSVAYPFGRAVTVEDDPGRGCWVTDRDSARVHYIRDDLIVVTSAPGLFERPVDLSVTGEGDCWVADQVAETLTRLDRQCLVSEQLIGVGEVTGVTYAPPTMDLWITRYNDSEVSRINSAGEMTTLYLSGCPRKVAGDWLSGCASDSSRF